MSKPVDDVRGVMSAPVVHVPPSATVAQAPPAMIDHDIGGVVVVEGDSAVGVFTERDLTRRVLDDSGLLHREVTEVMSAPVTIGGPDEEVMFVFRVMTEKNIRRLPVVEGECLVGIGTARDLLQWVDAVAKET